ncbi:tRNA pseudouridine(38-40) synthase TruA [Peribacillus psychrosaccharolyticus]|uniref:tRNA pseudouridine synthase A n=1 Tax=Peribacillus psychrosaccharolyticus TaxID=1407 RepID=A0A974NIY4_PERPY|nr:tRNA pseudouridine(38-40) synthase TruA [Peribacillus psychrosaccharolyticus]MEC2057977.1 tRNA pseudouridine(38-40) synthase TruA [Peribacillus psychrosaccharolyticus]MED3745853.1 tRNA pseudouridine(38-40) synthase TruA [Peribacillus psychrosaccharolyticus]QQS98741.1 tRNA pseudouridine(38-40) synthase TruA [Peribacillus psychrosaccharolyticus]
MHRIKCTISYDGTMFAGYQVQPDKRTVQSELETALARMHKGQGVKVTASGRTDAGVHAKGQVIHFDTPYTVPVKNWQRGLNSLLPDDIAVVKAEVVEDTFHARFDATAKEYRYFVSRSAQKDPFRKNYMYNFPFPLDLELIKQAISHLLGTHDFTSFCSAKTEVVDKVRTIHEIELYEEGDVLVFRFRGNGFLYNMIRILMGTLLEIGNGKLISSMVPEILQSKDRSAAGRTVPGQGLYLWEVEYKKS